MPDRRVRVAIQNVWAHFGQEKRRAVLTEGLRALDPDLVAFIEPIQRDGYDATRPRGPRARPQFGETVALSPPERGGLSLVRAPAPGKAPRT